MSRCVKCGAYANIFPIPTGLIRVTLCVRCLKIEVPCSECKTMVDLSSNSGCKCCYKPLCNVHMKPCHACDTCHLKHVCCGQCQTKQTNQYRCDLCHKQCHKVTRMFLREGSCCGLACVTNLCCYCLPQGSPTAHCKPHVDCKCGMEVCSDILKGHCLTCKKPRHKVVTAYTVPNQGCKATLQIEALQCCYCGSLPPGCTLERDKHMQAHDECKDCKDGMCPEKKWREAMCYRCKTVKKHIYEIECVVKGDACGCNECVFNPWCHNICCACYAANPNDIVTYRFCHQTPNDKGRFHKCSSCRDTICFQSVRIITKRGNRICYNCSKRYPHPSRLIKRRWPNGYGYYVWEAGYFKNSNNFMPKE